MNLQRRKAVVAACLAAACLAAALPLTALGQQPVRVILPVGAGSGMDGTVRSISNALNEALGRTLVLENIPGGGGILGTAQIAKAAPDGNTLGIVSNNHVVYPSVYKNLPFDPIEDVTPIMTVATLAFALLVHPSVPASNVQELVALAKQKPGALNYGSSGNGTILHLAGQMLLSEGDIQMTHIPYKSAGQLMNDLIGGQIHVGFFAVSGAAGHVRNGKLKALGVSTTARSPAMPDVPTIAEQGLKGYSLDGWFAVIAPAKLPAAEVQRIHSALKTALAKPEVRETLTKQGYTIYGMSPDETARYFRSELAKYAKLVKQAGVKIE